MNARRTIVGVSTLMVAAIVILAFPFSRLLEARSTLASAEQSLEAALHLEHELHSLRAATPTWLGRKRPTADVAALLLAVIKQSGLGPEVLAEVSPQDVASAARADSTTGVRWGEQGVTVRLNPLQLADLGSLLDHWRERHPEWAITSIDLQAQVRAADPATTVSFSSTIRLIATFVE